MRKRREIWSGKSHSDDIDDSNREIHNVDFGPLVLASPGHSCTKVWKRFAVSLYCKHKVSYCCYPPDVVSAIICICTFRTQSVTFVWFIQVRSAIKNDIKKQANGNDLFTKHCVADADCLSLKH